MRVALAAGVVVLAALTPLALPHAHHSYRPAFLESDRGIDPFVSTCRTTGRTPVVTANTNLIVGDTQVQLGQAAGCWTPQNEPSIAVDPSNPLHLIAGANDYRLCCDREGHNDGTGWVYMSADGGRTWLNRLLPQLTLETGAHQFLANVDSAGDPSVAFTSSSVALYANIAFRRDGAYSAITLSRSTDGGVHWLAPKVLAAGNDSAIFLDKEWVATGPGGLVAVTWTRFDNNDGPFGSARIYGRISHDGGVSFGAAVEVAPGQVISQGSAPAFAPDGTLYVAYETADFFAQTDAIAYSIAHAPYHHFAVHEIATDFDSCYPLNTDGRSTLSGVNFRINSFPSISVDPASGTAAVVWTDNQAGCGHPQTDSQIRVSYVHLSHHSVPVTISNGGDKTMPAAVLVNGVLTVGYYTTAYNTPAYSPLHPSVDYAYVSSRDGFVEHRVSDGSSDSFSEFKGSFLGDYSAAAAGSDGVVHLAWTDGRGGDFNVYSQAVTP